MNARSQWLTNERSWLRNTVEYSKLTTLIRTWIKAFKKPKPHFLTGPCKREITIVSKKCQSSNRTQDSTFSGTIFRWTLKIPSLSGWVLPSISTKTFFISSRHLRELSILSNLEKMTENLSTKGGSEKERAALMLAREDQTHFRLLSLEPERQNDFPWRKTFLANHGLADIIKELTRETSRKIVRGGYVERT